MLDGYAGSWSATTTPAGTSSTPSSPGCSNAAAHLPPPQRRARPAPGLAELGRDVRQVLSEAPPRSQAAIAAGRTPSTLRLLAGLRDRYDRGRLGRAPPTGSATGTTANHPGYVLARRLKAKADQIWLFTRDFAVPWTNNAIEQAVKGPKRHQAVSGYWHSLATLAGYCRVRSYLVTSRNHGIRPIDAIHLSGIASTRHRHPGLPAPAAP